MSVYPKRQHFEVHQGCYNPREDDFTFAAFAHCATEKEAENVLLETLANQLPGDILTQPKSQWRAAYQGAPLAIVRVTTQTTDYVAGSRPDYVDAEQTET